MLSSYMHRPKKENADEQPVARFEEAVPLPPYIVD